MAALGGARGEAAAGAAGVEMTTRYALASPRRLGSIRARHSGRAGGGNGSFDPYRAPAAASASRGSR